MSPWNDAPTRYPPSGRFNVAFKQFVVSLLGCCLWLLGSSATAQIPTYNLFNDTTTQLNFQTLDPARGTWKDQVLKGQEQKTFNMTSGDPSGKIRIATPSRGYNEYKIGAGGIYRLTWNDQKQMWDVRTVQPGYSTANPANPAQPVAAPRSNPAPSNVAALPYGLGDSVLVLWKQKWYVATVIRLGGEKVKIHYDGYEDSWDEWVDGARIRRR